VKKVATVLDDTPIGQAMEIKDKDWAKNLKWSHENSKQCSAQQDIIDEIYLEKDPIACSLNKRKRGDMPVTTVVRDFGQRQQGRYFFNLRLKGQRLSGGPKELIRERQANRSILRQGKPLNQASMKNQRESSIPKISSSTIGHRPRDRNPSRNSS
jgi:hypothetical protein